MLIYLNGLLLGLSLIMALGPQNVFLIKQGARRNHATLSAIVCFFCDMILAAGSVAGLHQLLQRHPALQHWMIGLGVCFLFYYAYKTLRSAFSTQKENSFHLSTPHSRWQIVLFALGFSLINPHAIIDTLVIIGSGSSQFPDHKMAFLLGVITASLIWFSSLTMTTRYFATVLTKNRVWQSFELLSGLLMASIGIKLALSGLF